jgi:hypothetical protein
MTKGRSKKSRWRARIHQYVVQQQVAADVPAARSGQADVSAAAGPRLNLGVMRTEPPSEFEAAILGQIASETTDSALGAQLAGIRVANREYTGVGCYSELVPPEGAPSTREWYGSRGPLSGPNFESSSVEHGGGTLLWFKEGRANALEIYAYGSYFPKDQADILPVKLTKCA